MNELELKTFFTEVAKQAGEESAAEEYANQAMGRQPKPLKQPKAVKPTHNRMVNAYGQEPEQILASETEAAAARRAAMLNNIKGKATAAAPFAGTAAATLGLGALGQHFLTPKPKGVMAAIARNPRMAAALGLGTAAGVGYMAGDHR